MKGPFTLEQARQLGVSRAQLQGASWRKLGAGTYAWAGLPDGLALKLAAVTLRLPPTAAFSGRTAAWLHGIDVPYAGDRVEVTVPLSSGVSGRVGVITRRALLRQGDVVVRRGMRTTSMARTLADLAQTVPLVDAVIATDAALHSRLVTMARLRAWIAERPGAKGNTRFRRVIRLAEPASESAMETRLRILFVQAGLPRPEAQVNLHDDAGRFLGRVDLYYPDSRLAIEYDGEHHRDRLVGDNRRQNGLLAAGYNLLRFTAPDILATPDLVVARVRAALSRPK
jgi:very-short-patch-repair endonuclease